MTVEPNRDQQPSSGPSLWPIGFALGVACILVGLIIGWPIAAVGGAIALIAGAFWVRDSSSGYSTPVETEPETRAARDAARARAPAGLCAPSRMTTGSRRKIWNRPGQRAPASPGPLSMQR